MIFSGFVILVIQRDNIYIFVFYNSYEKMAEKNTVFKQSIKHKGHWNFTDLYNFCFGFLKDEGYHVKEGVYTEKISGFGKELIIEWSAEKKVTDYFKNYIKVKWHVLGMKDAEVEQDGKKINTNKGEVKIAIEGMLENDYENRWENRPLWKFLRGIYEKYVIRTTVDQYENRLTDVGTKFVGEIKSFLQLSGR
jgi:hypothetical protein